MNTRYILFAYLFALSFCSAKLPFSPEALLQAGIGGDTSPDYTHLDPSVARSKDVKFLSLIPAQKPVLPLEVPQNKEKELEKKFEAKIRQFIRKATSQEDIKILALILDVFKKQADEETKHILWWIIEDEEEFSNDQLSHLMQTYLKGKEKSEAYALLKLKQQRKRAVKCGCDQEEIERLNLAENPQDLKALAAFAALIAQKLQINSYAPPYQEAIEDMLIFGEHFSLAQKAGISSERIEKIRKAKMPGKKLMAALAIQKFVLFLHEHTWDPGLIDQITELEDCVPFCNALVTAIKKEAITEQQVMSLVKKENPLSSLLEEIETQSLYKLIKEFYKVNEATLQEALHSPDALRKIKKLGGTCAASTICRTKKIPVNLSKLVIAHDDPASLMLLLLKIDEHSNKEQHVIIPHFYAFVSGIKKRLPEMASAFIADNNKIGEYAKEFLSFLELEQDLKGIYNPLDAQAVKRAAQDRDEWLAAGKEEQACLLEEEKALIAKKQELSIYKPTVPFHFIEWALKAKDPEKELQILVEWSGSAHKARLLGVNEGAIEKAFKAEDPGKALEALARRFENSCELALNNYQELKDKDAAQLSSKIALVISGMLLKYSKYQNKDFRQAMAEFSKQKSNDTLGYFGAIKGAFNNNGVTSALLTALGKRYSIPKLWEYKLADTLMSYLPVLYFYKQDVKKGIEIIQALFRTHFPGKYLSEAEKQQQELALNIQIASILPHLAQTATQVGEWAAFKNTKVHENELYYVLEGNKTATEILKPMLFGLAPAFLRNQMSRPYEPYDRATGTSLGEKNPQRHVPLKNDKRWQKQLVSAIKSPLTNLALFPLWEEGTELLVGKHGMDALRKYSLGAIDGHLVHLAADACVSYILCGDHALKKYVSSIFDGEEYLKKYSDGNMSSYLYSSARIHFISQMSYYIAKETLKNHATSICDGFDSAASCVGNVLFEGNPEEEKTSFHNRISSSLSWLVRPEEIKTARNLLAFMSRKVLQAYFQRKYTLEALPEYVLSTRRTYIENLCTQGDFSEQEKETLFSLVSAYDPTVLTKILRRKEIFSEKIIEQITMLLRTEVISQEFEKEAVLFTPTYTSSAVTGKVADQLSKMATRYLSKAGKPMPILDLAWWTTLWYLYHCKAPAQMQPQDFLSSSSKEPGAIAKAIASVVTNFFGAALEKVSPEVY